MAVHLAVLFLVVAPFLLAGRNARQQARGFDPERGALARPEPQSIYASDREDPWNEAFFLLFTRTITARVVASGAQGFAAGDERLPLDERRVTRIESGDRAIDPLYPSWLWMDSSVFDFDRDMSWRLLREPRYTRFVAALEGIRYTARTRAPLARAVMQADLWSVYDMLHQVTGARLSRAAGGGAEVAERARALLPLVATTMRTLALTREEIGRLPDTYSAAAKASGLPDLLGDRTAWMEIRWFPRRSHEFAAGHRRVARVFLLPTERPRDATAFLNQFRQEAADKIAALASVALLNQLLLVASDGSVVPSPITYQVQFRGTAARVGDTQILQYDLSRRQLLSSPASGGPRLDADPVVAPLRTRCSVCHGAAPGVGHMMTFSKHTTPGEPIPPVDRLVSALNVHPLEVARRKMELEDFKTLRQHWR